MTARDPARPPVQAKPIEHGDHAGHLAIVIAFRLVPDPVILPRTYQRNIERLLRSAYPIDGEVDVAVRVIGAQGEKSRDEGRCDRLDDVPVHRTARDTEDIDPGGKL